MKHQTNSAEYEAARAASNEAFAKFDKASTAYRNREICDDEFLKARAEYAKAEAAFDVAFAKERDRA